MPPKSDATSRGGGDLRCSACGASWTLAAVSDALAAGCGVEPRPKIEAISFCVDGELPKSDEVSCSSDGAAGWWNGEGDGSNEVDEPNAPNAAARRSSTEVRREASGSGVASMAAIVAGSTASEAIPTAASVGCSAAEATGASGAAVGGAGAEEASPAAEAGRGGATEGLCGFSCSAAGGGVAWRKGLYSGVAGFDDVLEVDD